MMTREEVVAEVTDRHLMQRRSDMAEQLKTEAGRRIIFTTIVDSGFFSATGSNERRSLGVELFDEVMHLAPERFLQMWKEAAAIDEDNARRLNEADED